MKTTKIPRAKETSSYAPFREKEADAGIIKSRSKASEVAEHQKVLAIILNYHSQYSLNLEKYTVMFKTWNLVCF